MEIVEKKNVQDFIKVSFLAREIRPSRETDDVAFSAAETFYEKYGSDEAFDKGVTEMGYQKRISGTFRDNQFSIVNLPQSRPVIDWAFNADKGDVQMFHLEDKHIVVRLKDKIEDGVPDLESVRTQIEAELINDKKAEQLLKKAGQAVANAGGDLQKIASNLGLQVSTASNATFGSNFIPQVGAEPEILGLAFGMNLNQVSEPVAGKQGVFIIQPTSVQLAEELPDYAPVSLRLNSQERNRYSLNSLLEAFKKEVEIVDNRRLFN
jgi:peptidyl-prolyl cis-trans isomerase D